MTELVVFEVKAAWLREDSLLEATGADFLRQLRRKYGVLAPAGAKRERPKGAAQLAKIIGAIARREWPGPEDAFARAIRIYRCTTNVLVSQARANFSRMNSEPCSGLSPATSGSIR